MPQTMNSPETSSNIEIALIFVKRSETPVPRQYPNIVIEEYSAIIKPSQEG
jgi:hypothetical protein